MLLDGDLQLPERSTPAMPLFIDGTGAKFSDFVFQPAAWHSGAPSAKRAFSQMRLLLLVLVTLRLPLRTLSLCKPKDSLLVQTLLCLQSLQMSPKVVL